MTEMFWTCFEITLNIWQGILAITFLNRVLPEKRSHKWPGILFSALFALCCSLYLIIDLPLVDTWLFIVPIVYSVFFRKGSLQTKLLWNTVLIMSYTGFISCMFFIYSLFGYSYAELMVYSPLRLWAIPLNNLILTVILFIISHKRPTSLDRVLPVILFTVINLLLSISIDFFWSLLEIMPELEQTVFLFSSLPYLIMLTALFLYRIMAEYAEHNTEMRKQAETYRQEEQRIDELKSIYSSLHTLRHDIKNHVQISRMLYESGKPEEGAAYIEKIDSDIFSLFSTSCLVVDSALTLKDLQMRRRGIRFRHELCTLDTLPVSDFDMCTVLSNLLDNSIEAIVRMETPVETPTINLKITRIRDMLYIHCSNPYDPQSVHHEEQRFITSKKQAGHGIGINTIQSITQKAQGFCNFTTDEHIFAVEIALPYNTGSHNA